MGTISLVIAQERMARMTTSPVRYSEVHFYFDESGTLHGEVDRRELLQVGGVVILGTPPEADLIDLLRQATAAAGGAFPADLHSHPGNAPLRREIVRHLRNRLAGRPDRGEFLIGAAIRHEEDLAPEGGLLTGESRADNRYQRMLIELLQHLLFVAPVLRQRLTADAQVFIHLPTRKVIFRPGEATRAQLEALGHRVYDHDDPPGSLRVGLSLGAAELTALLRGTLQQTWPQSTLHLAELPSIDRINYDPGRPLSLAGLYLADLFLFQGRNRIWQGGDLLSAPSLFATEVLLAYGPALQRQTQRSAALARGDVDRYLLLCRESDGLGGLPSSDAAAVRAAEEPEAARLMAEQNATPEALAEYAARVVDAPGRTAEGRELAERAQRLNNLLPSPEPRARLRVLQALLSAANHTGRIDEARRLWEEYRQAENALGTSLELQQFLGDVRNRWAVSLTDQLRHTEARAVLEDFIQDHEQTLQRMARRLGRPGLTPPIPELGALYGTLGQVYAFSESPEDNVRAEGAFRHALRLQEGDAGGCARQWVYLGHLACDRGESGRPLWDEVCSHLPAVAGTTPVAADQGQFLLALQIKGLLCFGTAAARKAFLAAWDTSNPPAQYPEDQRQQHPFGLIYQALGLLRAQVWRESGPPEEATRALEEFDRATKHMEQHGALLQVLGCIARLHRGLLVLEAFGARPGARGDLAAQVRALRGLAERAIGPTGAAVLTRHDPGDQAAPEERARRLIATIRFNYW
jgi:hypothetical protein